MCGNVSYLSSMEYNTGNSFMLNWLHAEVLVWIHPIIKFHIIINFQLPALVQGMRLYKVKPKILIFIYLKTWILENPPCISS